MLVAAAPEGLALLQEDRRRRDAWLAQRLRDLPADDLAVLRRAADVLDRLAGVVSGTFRSLRVRNYRLFAGGQVVSLSGTWAQRVAQDWLVLELSGDSGVALGITTGLQFLPVLLFGLYGGVLADRYDKRRLLLGAQAAMGVLALLLAALDLSGAVQLWHVYALAFALGMTSVVDTPVRQAFISEVVGPEDLTNAVSLNSATFNSARIVGPALGGRAHRVGRHRLRLPRQRASATWRCSPASRPCGPPSCTPAGGSPGPRARRARAWPTSARARTCSRRSRSSASSGCSG